MRVFVLCTGRCGSTAFAKTCKHATNYTAGHETNWGKLEDRIEYPDNHIEVDNRLSFLIPSLTRKYPDALYVHLIRTPEAVARSYLRRWNFKDSLMVGWCRQIMTFRERGGTIEAARHLVESVNDMIGDGLLYRGVNFLRFTLENWSQEFPHFWKTIQAEGNLNAAMNEFTKMWNKSPRGTT